MYIVQVCISLKMAPLVYYPTQHSLHIKSAGLPKVRVLSEEVGDVVDHVLLARRRQHDQTAPVALLLLSPL